MIGLIRGWIASTRQNRLLLEVGNERGGSCVGYWVSVPANEQYQFPDNGPLLTFFTYTHVREDVLDLYGFLTEPERDLFLTLLQVSGVGPKLALSILGHVDLSRFVNWVLTSQVSQLVSIPGVGKKLAERLVLELKEVFQKKMKSGDLKTQELLPPAIQEATDALIGLGYKSADLDQLFREDWIKTMSSRKVEDYIKAALQRLAP